MYKKRMLVEGHPLYTTSVQAIKRLEDRVDRVWLKSCVMCFDLARSCWMSAATQAGTQGTWMSATECRRRLTSLLGAKEATSRR